MCTLIVLHGCTAETPLAIGANRDEFLARPAEGPARRQLDFGGIVAPRDVKAGGTWLGVNEYGVFAAVTNRPTEQADSQRRSRGLLVLDALRERSAICAMEKLEHLPAEAYNPFNLLVADRDSVHAITYEHTAKRVEFAGPVIVIGNADPMGPLTPKLEQLTEQAERIAQEPGDRVLDSLADICRSHNGGDELLRNVCVHAGEYGTRSSTLLRFGEDPRDSELRFTDQAPCESDYRDYSPLLRELNESSAA